MENMEEYMHCLSVIAATNHIETEYSIENPPAQLQASPLEDEAEPQQEEPEVEEGKEDTKQDRVNLQQICTDIV